MCVMHVRRVWMGMPDLSVRMDVRVRFARRVTHAMRVLVVDVVRVRMFMHH